jgi:hypothetical protein
MSQAETTFCSNNNNQEMFSIEECMTQNAFDHDTIPQALKSPKSPRSKLTVKSAAEFGYANVAIT